MCVGIIPTYYYVLCAYNNMEMVQTGMNIIPRYTFYYYYYIVLYNIITTRYDNMRAYNNIILLLLWYRVSSGRFCAAVGGARNRYIGFKLAY